MTTCDKCKKQFKFRCLLIRHLNNKNGCTNITNKIANEENPIDKCIKIHTKINNLKAKIKRLENLYEDTRCGFCKKLLSNKTNLKLHMSRTCKNKSAILNDIKELTDELDNKKQEQEDIDTLKKIKNITNNNTNNGTINNTTNNNINNNNNTINITMNPFGKEDLSHITDANYRKYMLDIFPGFINFITKIYYDDIMPSNHNMCIKNIKSNYGYFYDGEKWNIIDRDDLINNLIAQKTKLLNNKYTEFEENNKTTENLEDAFTHFITTMRKPKDEGKDNLKKQLRNLLYNNREKIKQSELLIKNNE